jgi:hypothetical protein
VDSTEHRVNTSTDNEEQRQDLLFKPWAEV